MAKFSLPRIALSAGIVFGAATIASAQDSGALLNLLSRKGIITDQEAEELRAELTSEFAANTPAGKLDISSGITKLRIAGDLRVRYQYDNEQANPAGTNNNQDRSRYRYRFRLGTTATLGSKWTAGLRFESNTGATSTNNDFGSGTDNFSKTTDGVNLGQVFIQYNDTGVFGSDALDIRVGKFGHKFFNPGVNGFWIDSDINFEGLAEEIVYGGLIDGWKTSLRAGQFILNANSTAGADANDPSLLLIGQVEFANKQWKIAPTFVGFAAPSAHDASANTPALQASDTAVYTDLATFLLPVEFSTAFAGRPLAVYATYGINLEGEARARRLAQTRNVDDDVTIANVGVRYGAAKIPGEYQLTAEYRHVGNGSYSSLLLDSDFNGGYLNGKGFILSGTYAITEAISATATYFNAFNIEGDRPAGGSTNRGDGFGKAQVLQIDLSAKF